MLFKSLPLCYNLSYIGLFYREKKERAESILEITSHLVSMIDGVIEGMTDMIEEKTGMMIAIMMTEELMITDEMIEEIE